MDAGHTFGNSEIHIQTIESNANNELVLLPDLFEQT